MKQIKNILILILTLAIALGSLTSCEIIEQLGITIPGMGNEGTGDENNNVNTCDEHVTYTKDAISATCIAEGYTGDEVCYFCGAVVTAGEVIAKTAHSYVNGKCSVCGDETTAPSKAELWASQYETITIAEALALCEEFVSSPSETRYYIIATVKSVDDTAYGKLTIMDETGEIMVYGTNSADGSLKYDKMGIELKAGDVVLLYGTLQNYRGTTKEVQNAWLIDSVAGVVVPPSPTITPDSNITIADAIANAGLVSESDRFYITATVKTVTKAQFGAMILTDAEGNEISVYNSKNADGTVDYSAMEDKPYKGDTVTVYATLHLFNGTPEISSAWIISFEHADFDDSQYTAMTVQEARNAEKGSYVKLTGVVASITYANGYIPAGFYLVDGTNSIYVYDRDATAMVSVGNTVTVAGVKDFWILDTEINSANKFDYKGCNQIANAYVLENDGGNSDFDKSWITESTVKDIMDTPITEDITTTIFKVTALVNKVPGSGFINYYINDLDGTTGSYVYTQCNGGDFAWLDEFDGKICTVYLSVINAKSSAAGCIWRFHPVAVAYENFKFDLNDAPEFAVDYYGIPGFESTYMTDAKLELITEVSSELLGFSGATLSYAVSDETVANILSEDGKLYFHTFMQSFCCHIA